MWAPSFSSARKEASRPVSRSAFAIGIGFSHLPDV